MSKPVSPEAWKEEAAKVSTLNCLSFFDEMEQMDDVPALDSPVRLAEGTDQGPQLLRTLFKSGDRVCLSTDVRTLAATKIKDAHQIRIEKPRHEKGGWFKINRTITDKPSGRRGGVTDADSDTRLLMLEMDAASRPAQLQFWRAAVASGFPLVSLTDSAGKSFHGVIRVNCATHTAYAELAEAILDLLEPFIPDSTSRNPSRWTRLPGFIRGTGETQRAQELVYLNPDAPVWSWDNPCVAMLKSFRSSAAPVPERVKSALKRRTERRERDAGAPDEALDGDFRKRLNAVLGNRLVDLGKYAADAGWIRFSAEPVAGLENKHFVTCPFSENHTGGGSDDGDTDAYIFERVTEARFKWGFHCSHHACADRKIVDVLERAKEEAPETFRDAILPERDVLADFGDLPDIETAADEAPAAIPEGLLLARPNDFDNTAIFTGLFSGKVRYFHDEKAWLLWDGSRWKRDRTAGIARLAHQVALMRVKAAGTDDDAVQTAKQAGSETAVGNILKLGRTHLPIASSSAGFDARPMHLGCPNGTLDLETGRLLPATPEQHITLQCGVPYNPEAACPDFLEALSAWQPDPEVVAFLRRYCGYCLTGNASEQKMLIFYGTGRNGKSTLVNVLMDLLGDYAIKSPQALLISARMCDSGRASPEIAQLANRRLAVVTETQASGHLDAAKVKDITGMEPVSTRINRGDWFTVKPHAKILLSSNHKPVIKDTDEGVWRRMVLVPFTQDFAGREDFTLPARLEAEKEGILAWMVQGCLEWQERGLCVPPCLQSETAEYREAEDVLGTFLRERTGLTPEKHAGQKELYEEYSAWSRESGQSSMGKIAFNRSLKDRKWTTCRMDGKVMWRDITIKPAELPEFD